MARGPRQPSRNSAALNPSTPSLSYKAQQYRWWLMSSCLGGTETMRAAGQALLPKHQGENQLHYDERAATTVFTNFTRLTLDFLVGKPFSEKAKFRVGTPQVLLDLETDIDMKGNDITTVCRDFLWKGMAKGTVYMMVEFPKQIETEITLADQQQKGLRPYWVVLDTESVISAVKMRIGGKDEFVHVRVLANETVRNGFDEVVITRIYEYNLMEVRENPNDPAKYQVAVTIWRKKANGKDEWEIDVPMTMASIDRIPMVELNTESDGRPPLLDCAYLNVRHWQSSSDQTACLTMARFPILAGSGVDKEDGRIIGPYELLVTSDPTAKFYYVENTGAALAVGDKDVISLEDKMAMYGAQMLKKRPGRETAAARIIDEAQNMAPLQIVVLQTMSALEQVCDITLKWLEAAEAQDENTYGIDLNLDFALSEDQQKEMTFFENARLQGDCSREQFWLAAQRLGFCPTDFPISTNETQLQAEADMLQKRQAALAAMKGQQGPGGGTGDPLNNPNDPKITKKTDPGV